MSEAADTLRKNWLASLAHERRASPHTLRAYGDDVARFIGFQAGHTGGAVSEKTLAKLTPADIRAFITDRRRKAWGRAACSGRWRRCELLQIPGERRHAGKCRRPFHPHPAGARGLPRPLSVEDAGRAITGR